MVVCGAVNAPTPIELALAVFDFQSSKNALNDPNGEVRGDSLKSKYISVT